MFHFNRKAGTAFAIAVLLLLLTACSGASVAAAGTTSKDALANAQPTSTTQSSSILSLTVQPYPTQYTVYEVGSTMSNVVATGIDDLGPGDPITATIDWGDKTAPTRYTFIDGRTFQIAGAHPYSKVGKYTITVTAAITIFQQSTTGTGTITVVPPYALSVKNIRYTVGRSFHGIIATGTDPFPKDTLQGTINWGDQTSTTGVQVVSSAKGAYQINATHPYSQAGSWTITVSLTSFIVGPITGTGEAAVFTLSANNITVHAGRPFTVNVAMITGPISSGGLRVIIEWGDGMVSKLNLSGGKTNLRIQGSHTYSQAGTYTIIVILRDNGTGEQANARAIATVI